MTRAIRRLLSFLLIFGAVFFLARYTPVFNPLKTIFKPAPVAVAETPLFVTEIKNIAQLMTIEAYNEVVVDSTRYPFGIPPQVAKRLPVNGLQFLGAAQLVLIVRGKVVAGTDLQRLDTSAFRIKGDSLFIQLPPAALLDVITNPSDVETFIEKGSWNEAAAAALKTRARAELVRQALAQGVLPQADARARQLVHGLLKNTGYKTVVVTTAVRLAAPSGKQ